MITRRFFCFAAPAFIAATKLDFGVPKKLILPGDEKFLTALDYLNWYRTPGMMLIPRNRFIDVAKAAKWNMDIVKVKVIKNGRQVTVEKVRLDNGELW